MTVRLVGQPNPAKLPEHIQWTLRKGARIAQARTRMIPIGEGLPELRIYVSRSSDPAMLDLLWSQVMKDGRDVGALSEERKAAFLQRVWAEA